MALTEDETRFLYGHALDYARPDIDADMARAYANWYLDRFVYGDPDASMDDMPAHTYAFPRFRDSYEEAPEVTPHRDHAYAGHSYPRH